MPIRKPFVWRGFVDLSWNKYNLFNLNQYSRQGPEREVNKTAFQLRWRAKQLVTAYHAPHLTQHQFRHLRQKALPKINRKVQLLGPGKDLTLPMPPTTMLGFSFMERRLDVVLFRSCFVPSIWEARRLCLKGNVEVNGKRVCLPGYVMEDGDIAQITRPEFMTLMKPANSRPEEEWEEWERKMLSANASEAESSNDSEGEAESSSETNAAADEISAQETSEGETAEGKKPRPKYPTKDHGLNPVPYMAPWMFIPEYLEVNFNNLSTCLLRSPIIKPGRCEIPSPYDEITHQRFYDLR